MAQPIIEIPERLFQTAEFQQFEGSWDAGALVVGPDEYRFVRPFSWSVSVSNTGGALLVSGTVEGRAETECARCLEPFELDLSGEVEGYFIIPGMEAEGQEEDEEAEFDLLPEDGKLDMEPLLSAALIVDLPLQPLCDEDCQGLCPQCGKNLNDGPCGCEPPQDDMEFEEAKNPFGALKGYTFDE